LERRGISSSLCTKLHPNPRPLPFAGPPHTPLLLTACTCLPAWLSHTQAG
jgi:hypothetical protein